MRLRTVAVLVVLVLLLGGGVVFGLGMWSSGGSLHEKWISDTARHNEVNHHPIGVGPNGDVILAPIAEVPHQDGVPITNSSCALARLAPANGSVLWQASIPAKSCFTHAITQPNIQDVDGDGNLEAVISTTEDALIAYDAQTGTEQWRVPLSTYGYGRPTIGNVTAAPGPEVVTSDIDGGVVVARNDGTVAWRFALNATDWHQLAVWEAPVVGDIDADGQPEVLVGSNRGPILLNHTGGIEWRRDGAATYITTAHVDGDAASEVFTADTNTVRAYDGASGSIQWNRSISNGRIHTAADGDGDGTVELYVGQTGGTILALDASTGETEWSTSISNDDGVIVPSPVLGDVNGDGQQEVLAVTNHGTVVVLDAKTGEELARYKRKVRVWTFVTPADIDHDGAAEILVRYGDARVVALDYGS